jgi:hypothetical protein
LGHAEKVIRRELSPLPPPVPQPHPPAENQIAQQEAAQVIAAAVNETASRQHDQQLVTTVLAQQPQSSNTLQLKPQHTTQPEKLVEKSWLEEAREAQRQEAVIAAELCKYPRRQPPEQWQPSKQVAEAIAKLVSSQEAERSAIPQLAEQTSPPHKNQEGQTTQQPQQTATERNTPQCQKERKCLASDAHHSPGLSAHNELVPHHHYHHNHQSCRRHR